MAENLADDDDDEGFGDFMFAPNPTAKSTPNSMNGADFFFTTSASNVGSHDKDDDDDDDWGDFVKSPTALSLTKSIPNSSSLTSKPSDPFGFHVDHTQNGFVELTQPGSLSLVNVESSQKAQNQWGRLQGALPLSIFGEEEEEEEGSKGDPSLNNLTVLPIKTNNENESANGSSLNVSVGFEDLIGKLYTTSKAENGAKMGSNGMPGLDTNISNSGKIAESDSNGKHWDWNGSGLNGVVNSSGTVTNLDNYVINTDKNESHIGTDAANLSWNPLNLNQSVRNNGIPIPVPNGKTSLTSGLNSALVKPNEELDEDDAWDFKDAEPTLPAGMVHDTGENKVENAPPLGSHMPSSSWDVLKWDLNGMNNNVNGMHSDTAQPNSTFAGESEDFGSDDGWEFKGAESETQMVDESTKAEEITGGVGSTFEFGKCAKDPGALFAASDQRPQNSGGWDFEFGFNSSSRTENSTSSPEYVQRQQMECRNGTFSSQAKGNIDSDGNLWAFNDEFSETGPKDKEESQVDDVSPHGVEAFAFAGEIQESELKLKKTQGPLPLSLFGGDMEEEDPIVPQDMFTPKIVSSKDHPKSPGSVVTIKDLISSLYSLPDENTSTDLADKPSDGTPAFTQSVMESNLENGPDDFDDDSWEFKGSDSINETQSQTVVPHVGGLNEIHVNKEDLTDYVDLYSRLKDELLHIAVCHYDNLKGARCIAAESGKDSEVKALDKEIQDLHNQLHQYDMATGEVHSESLHPKSIGVDYFLHVLQDPKYQVFESEYLLSKRLSLATEDLKLTIELLKHAASTQKILTLLSTEEQSYYISTWTNLVSICAQELGHGAWVWKQATQNNVQHIISSKPQGKKYLLSLRAIYRVVEIIGSSAKLYKPWILLTSANNPSISTLLSECSTIWSCSGLEEAIQNMSNSTDFDSDETGNSLLESINRVGDQEAFSLYDKVFSGKEPTCGLSFLTSGAVPGMKMVVWNGGHYFLALANLWANLVSSDPPSPQQPKVG